jgi:hypothetical protein
MIEALRSKQRRTDPPLGGELGEANALAGIQKNHLRNEALFLRM